MKRRLIVLALLCVCFAARAAAQEKAVADQAARAKATVQEDPVKMASPPAGAKAAFAGTLVADGPTPPSTDPPPCDCGCYSVFSFAFWSCAFGGGACCLNDAPGGGGSHPPLNALWRPSPLGSTKPMFIPVNDKEVPAVPAVKAAPVAKPANETLVADGGGPVPLDPPPCDCSCYSVFSRAFWSCAFAGGACCVNDAPGGGGSHPPLNALRQPAPLGRPAGWQAGNGNGVFFAQPSARPKYRSTIRLLNVDAPLPKPSPGAPPPPPCECGCYSAFSFAFWSCTFGGGACCLNDAPGGGGTHPPLDTLWHSQPLGNASPAAAPVSARKCPEPDLNSFRLDDSTIVLTAEQRARLWPRMAREVRPDAVEGLRALFPAGDGPIEVTPQLRAAVLLYVARHLATPLGDSPKDRAIARFVGELESSAPLAE
ncbi:MAG TPA: hypothetical protein VEH49_06125 [Methylomirabilota bacterium]|nr:hypothetical protein [Methylomirabilota bacterium]